MIISLFTYKNDTSRLVSFVYIVNFRAKSFSLGNEECLSHLYKFWQIRDHINNFCLRGCQIIDCPHYSSLSCKVGIQLLSHHQCLSGTGAGSEPRYSYWSTGMLTKCPSQVAFFFKKMLLKSMFECVCLCERERSSKQLLVI